MTIPLANTRWLITGAAGFIGSHLVDYLLTHQAEVLGLDNFSSGSTANVTCLQTKHANPWPCLAVDIRDADTITQLCKTFQPHYVVHLAAQVSVTESINHPHHTHDINVTGFFNVLMAAKAAQVSRFIYISSSAVYGEQSVFPIAESAPLQPLSLYGLSKLLNEQYAELFAAPDFVCVGLRLFNIFGNWQQPDSPYAAVIPKWMAQLRCGQAITVFGDGSATRDFCHVDNVTQAIGQLTTAVLPAKHNIYNIGSGKVTSLNTLSTLLLTLMQQDKSLITYQSWRAGDILHSYADIKHAQQDFAYQVLVDLEAGLRRIANTS